MRILVTGAGRGLGAALSRHLATTGHEVLVHYRSSLVEASELVAEIHSNGGVADLLQADLGSVSQVAAMAREIADRGGLDALINNAGSFMVKRYDELDPEEWDRQLTANLTAAFNTTRALLPQLRDGRGRIINITDAGAGRIGPRPMTLPYSIAKTGLLILTKTLAKEEASNGVTVNAVAPGILENSDPLPDVSSIPAGRYGTFADVVGVVSFLLSDDASYVTGASIPVTGGWNL